MKKQSNNNKSEILNCLWAYQRDGGYIRSEDIKECSRKFGISQVELRGIISFYHFFHQKPSGQFRIYLNNSIVSEFKGFKRIKEAFENETGGSFGGTDPSGQFGLFETSCIGLSDLEPAALINFHPFVNLNTLKVKNIIAKLKQGLDPASFCDVIPDNIRSFPKKEKAIFNRDYHTGIIVSALQDLSPEAVIEMVKKSGLKGMGGAFFPTGLKWELCKNQNTNQKYIICNADEGEPGTFKDRVLMNSIPGLLLEGMIVAAYAVGSSKGIIYLRAEYTWLKEKLDEAIRLFHKMNLLGKDIRGIKGFNFEIKIQLGAGAYVCGEETALLNSLEGKRGEPRTKQFFPTEKGLNNKPTVINNVETLCAAARVIELGSDFFLNTGTTDSPGTKLLSVSGDCRLPGIYEIEWGTSVDEVLNLCKAQNPFFIQISGPSGQCISIMEKDRKIEKDDLPCGGSFMIFNENRDILSILANYTNFFKEESCGLCTPCRAGNFIIQRRLEKISKKLAYPSDYKNLKEWGHIMNQTCRCGLGRSSAHSLTLALDKFPEYFDSKVDHHKEGLNIEFDLERAIQDYDQYSN